MPGMRKLQNRLRSGRHQMGEPARRFRHKLSIRLKRRLIMDIIVCIKPVLDPDLPPMKFSIDTQKNSVIQPEGMPPVMNPYDALAVEAALQIKEKQKAGKVTVVTLG